MKTIAKTLLMLFIIAMPVVSMAQEKEKKSVIVKFDTSIDCQNCVNTIMKNIPFEKGVKDVKCDLATKIVTVEFQPEKNTVEKLQRAIEKLGYTAKEIKEKEENK